MARSHEFLLIERSILRHSESLQPTGSAYYYQVLFEVSSTHSPATTGAEGFVDFASCFTPPDSMIPNTGSRFADASIALCSWLRRLVPFREGGRTISTRTVSRPLLCTGGQIQSTDSTEPLSEGNVAHAQ